MKGTINLSKAIKINGREVESMSYDTDKVTVDLYLKAINRAVTQGNGITGANIKVDAGAQLMLGLYSVVADNPEFDITDVERVSGVDIMKFAGVGLAFILGREDPTAEPSEKQSEPIPELSIQA